VKQINLRAVIAMLTLVMVVLQTQAVSGAIIVVFLRLLLSLVQVELQHVKIAREKIQVVSTRVKVMQLEIHGRKIAIRVCAIMVVKFLARHCLVH